MESRSLPTNFGSLYKELKGMPIICPFCKGVYYEIRVFKEHIAKAHKLNYCPLCGRKLTHESWKEWRKHCKLTKDSDHNFYANILS